LLIERSLDVASTIGTAWPIGRWSTRRFHPSGTASLVQQSVDTLVQRTIHRIILAA
jgi:hypothetical protein